MAKKIVNTPVVEKTANPTTNNVPATTPEVKKRGKRAGNAMTITLDKDTQFKVTFECDASGLSNEALLKVARTGYLATLKTAASKYFAEYGPVTRDWANAMKMIEAQKDNPKFNQSALEGFVELQRAMFIANTGIDPLESLRLHWVINDALILGTDESDESDE